jgi:fibro-slime domain-containing protein
MWVTGCGGAPPSFFKNPDAGTAYTPPSGGQGGNEGGPDPTLTFEVPDGGTGDADTCANGSCVVDAGSLMEAGAVCGDGIVEPGETCDDGNSRPGDGCSGICQTEPGSTCASAGHPCMSNIVCGDGVLEGNEGCDDGNTVANDGCSATCQVETGYGCTGVPSVCSPSAPTSLCGNGIVEAGETCDDRNTVSNDGCSATCQIEAGYTCPSPGSACKVNHYCGDGIVQSGETCDDGNTRPGDCCDGTCHIEPNCKCENPSPPLPSAPQICSSTIVCGDKIKEPGEACDDGNTVSGDGCSADCQTVESGYTCATPGTACTAAPQYVCGNGTLDSGEQCDDGNKNAGDGCSADCKVEPGYVCPAAGKSCATISFCGDGKVDYARGEQCDDSNTAGGDGCSGTCQVETGWVCDNTAPPSKCAYTVVCGDKKLEGTETCDDGNNVGSDGCSATCQVETGYTCPIVGAACKPICGDGALEGSEQCDDGNALSGDGCSSTCKLEPGYMCSTRGAACVATVCGDGQVQGSEQCDDGTAANTGAYGHCNPDCTLPVTCGSASSPVGACANRCGDGILLAPEVCDDGNTASGDGCSADCTTIERGFTCSSSVDNPPTEIDLPLILRDFQSYPDPNNTDLGHPDFENLCCGVQSSGDGLTGTTGTSIVHQFLGADRKPQYNGTDASPIHLTTGLTNFNDWYNTETNANANFSNYQVLQTLKLVGQKNANGSLNGTYVFNSVTDPPYGCPTTMCTPAPLGGFFPLDGLGFGNHGRNHNFSFTSEVRYWFVYKGTETLTFSGDDDVWVFINGKRAVDIGGVHSRTVGMVSLPLGADMMNNAQFALTKGSIYEVAVFQAERHTTESNYWLTLANFLAGKSSCVSVCGDAIVTPDEACDLGTANNTGNYGTCTASCTLAPYCGDRVTTTPPEQCDDGQNATLYDNTGSRCGPGCMLPHFCGDANVDTSFGETCDKGLANSDTAYGPGSCNKHCATGPFCGDGFRNGAEQCDDGMNNGTPSSFCDATCNFKCGNGVLDSGEQCDLGAAKNTGAYGGCDSTCTLAPFCGDGIREGSEQCDDGKNDGTYGTCAPGCVLPGYCGDDKVETPPETCDLGQRNSAAAYGQGMCTLQCLPAPYCGDGRVDPTEKCDDGVNSGLPGSCAKDCSSFIPVATCGNGNIDTGEQCDDGAANNAMTTGNGTSGSTCDIHCQLKCGDGVKDPGEQCDDGKDDGSYGTCNPNCTLAPYCGDGMKNGAEQCDQGAQNSSTAYGPNLCTTVCTIAPYCGDGRIQTRYGEQCDGNANCTGACTFYTAR